eukprot:SAG25_NODE_4954_length_725_cov_1.311502_1_plen_61_part_10
MTGLVQASTIILYNIIPVEGSGVHYNDGSRGAVQSSTDRTNLSSSGRPFTVHTQGTSQSSH